MAKPMLVTLPFVMLLLDFWPLNSRVAGCTRTAGATRFNRAIFGGCCRKNSFLSARGDFLRRHFSGAAPGGSGRLAGKNFVALPPGKRAGGRRPLSAENDLAGRPRRHLSDAGQNSRVCGRRRGRRLDSHFRRRLARAPAESVFARRLAVVFGHARAGDRPGAGRWRGAGGPLHLHPIHRPVHRRGVRPPRFGRAGSNFSKFPLWSSPVLFWPAVLCSRKTNCVTGATANALSPTRWP